MLKNNITKVLLGLMLITSSCSYANHTPATGSENKANIHQKNEKCAGVVKAGKGDGSTVINGVVMEWIYVPVGSCYKLSDSSTIFE